MEELLKDSMFLLVDTDEKALGRAELMGAISDVNLELKVHEGDIDLISDHEIIHIVGMGDTKRSIRCQFVKAEGNIIYLNKIMFLSPDYRRNLRVPVKFDSFIYPVSGKWQGRYTVESVDLTCGGVAFFADFELEDNEIFEIVVPVTSEPVLLKCKLLRHYKAENSDKENLTFHAAKFLDLCHDEEKIVRGAVFRIQLENVHKIRRAKES